ncbi:DUF4030 domain-containing protein [Peribacillus frigoritolerans]|uniref:DUF4030 domain-containing protein n=1 Tax=Peribacillus frigoritolerans TaxID=450367 RepID=UPI0024C134FA|nr:DUF4030 domain-containing protein [Peribacillus frigoritolerans]WHX61261.1 DUF4030 domain-containing protein [Peribacillus frigoritolerans]
MKKQYEDTDLVISLKKLNADLLWKTKQKQELKKRIISDIEKLESQERSKIPLLSTRIKKVSLIRKLTYSGIALSILLGLFIGSAFISPAMAEVMSKIPYLNKVLHTKDIFISIQERLENEGYKTRIGTNGDNKIEIRVDGSEQYFQDVRKDVEETALEVLRSREYDGYTIKVIKNKVMDEEKPSPEIIKQYEEASKVQRALDQELKKHNYHDVITQVGTLNNSGDLIFNIGIPTTEKDAKKIKELVQNVITKETDQKYTLKFNKINLKIREQENRWGRVISTIIDGLYSKKEYQVNGFSFSAHPQPMTLYIKTTISSSNRNSKQHGIKIEDTIREFLESEEAKKIIKEDEYKIIIYSKDKQQIN